MHRRDRVENVVLSYKSLERSFNPNLTKQVHYKRKQAHFTDVHSLYATVFVFHFPNRMLKLLKKSVNKLNQEIVSC